MAHEIDHTTGQAAVFVTGTPAWHKLGRVIDAAANSADAIKLAGLDWTVEQWPLLAYKPHTSLAASGIGDRLVRHRVANVRTDTGGVLGVVGTDYRVFQNRECFDFMDALVGDKLAMYETAGSLKGGRRVWMLARIPGEYRVGRDDVVKPYVLLTNSHDGTRALKMIPTTIRVVCQNTLNLALASAGSEGLNIPHHPCLDNRVNDARRKLGIVTKRLQQFNVEVKALAGVQLTDRRLDRYFKSLLPDSETPRATIVRDAILATMHENFTNERNALPGIKGSAWAAYNAVSEWADHQRPARGKDDTARADSQLNSIWFGESHRIKQAAFNGALELAGLN